LKTETELLFPEYLAITSHNLGRDVAVKVRIKTDMASVAHDLAETMFEEIKRGDASGRGVTMIVPVGPVDQYPILAAKLNQESVSCRNAMFINMDEYLGNDDEWLGIEHPLSFRGYMDRHFYGVLHTALAPPIPQRVFPDPRDPQTIARIIAERGGVDVCFGGIGINGHVAFNEPPENEIGISTEEFAASTTRVLTLRPETRAINSVTVGGELSLIPERAVTVGMKEILASKRLRFYCNRHWQSGVVRRALHGPLTPECPASFLRTHPDASITMTDYVAASPIIQLR
jgi:glucosamine-6-phosphate deaminase